MILQRPGVFLTGAMLGATGVALGAWGAHGLQAYLGHAETSAWDTAVLYQLIHAPVLLCLAFAATDGTALRVACGLLGGGVVLFAGSLYLLVLGGPGWLGPVTPVGGTLLIAGWLVLCGYGLRRLGKPHD